MNIYTLQDALDDRGIKTVAGVCLTSAEGLAYINSAIRMIYRRGDWPGTVVSAQFCTDQGCVVFPEFVGPVRELNICGNPIPLKNAWWEFALYGPGTRSRCCGPSDFTTINRGQTPVFKNVPCGKSLYARFYTRCQADLGKTVTVWGIDSNGQPLMTKVDGVWVEGMTLTLATPFVSTSTTIQSITRVRKDVTQCIVDGYFYDADANLLLDMAHYKGKETNPSYALYKLAPTGSYCVKSCNNVRQVQVLFKLALYPVSDPEDLLPVQNLEAIKMMLNSIKKTESGDLEGAREQEAMSIHEMNLQARDTDADDQIPVEVAVFGAAKLYHHRIGSNL